MRFYRRLAGATLLFSVLLGLVVSACGSSSGTPTPAGTTAATSVPQPTATRPAVTAAPTAAPAATATPSATSSGEVKIALGTISPNLFPGVAVGGVENVTMDTMFDYFIGAKNDDSMEADSGFITAWSANADSSVWTFKLRDNMFFHNGDKASALDAVFTLQMPIKEPAKFSRGAEFGRVVKNIETPDSTTMIVTLNVADIYWQVNYLKRGVPFTASPKIVAPARYAQAIGLVEANKKPVGSGPYKFKSFLVDQQLQVEAVDRHYYFGVPKTKTLTFLAIPDESTRVALLQTNGADLAPVASAPNIKRAQGTAALKQVSRKGSLTWNLWNFQYPDNITGFGKNPLTLVDVRKALFWHAIDRKTIVDSFMPGFAAPSMDYPVFSWDVGDWPDLPVPAFDVAKAKAMLAAAGYPNGFEMALYTSPSAPYPTAEVSEALAVMWQNVGMKVTREAIGGTSLQADYYQKKGYSKPVVHFSVNVSNRPLSASTAQLNHNKDAFFSTNADAEAYRLATVWLGAKNVDDYKKAGLAYQQYAYNNVLTGVCVFVSDEVWFRTDKISDKWSPGLDGSPSARYAYAGALR